jgi:hypothetical protein
LLVPSAVPSSVALTSVASVPSVASVSSVLARLPHPLSDDLRPSPLSDDLRPSPLSDDLRPSPPAWLALLALSVDAEDAWLLACEWLLPPLLPDSPLLARTAPGSIARQTVEAKMVVKARARTFMVSLL